MGSTVGARTTVQRFTLIILLLAEEYSIQFFCKLTRMTGKGSIIPDS